MSQKPPPHRDLVPPPRTGEAWLMALLVGAAGALVGASYSGMIGAVRPGPALTLVPYADLSWTNGLVSWLSGAFESPLGAAAALFVAAGALALLSDAIIRRVLLQSKPGAAALASALVLLAAAWGNVLRLDGHWGILAGAAIGLTGCVLLTGGPLAATWAGAASVAVAPLFHPAWLGLACAAPVLVSWPRRRAVLFGLACAVIAALVAALAWRGDVPMLGWAERLRWGARDLASAPILAFAPWRRLDVPTGYESLAASWPVWAGLAAHALTFGLGMMIGGIRSGIVCAAAAVAGVVGAALAVPGWIPGDRGFALPAMIACAPMIALVLAVFPARLARSALPGAILGVSAVAVLLAVDRAERWSALGPAMDLARETDPAAGSILAAHREPDPARLVLFLNLVQTRDAYAPSLVAAADMLLDAGAPALFPDRLRAVVDKLMSRAGRRRKDPEFDKLLAEVSAELALAERMWGSAPAFNFDGVCEALVQVHTKVLDLNFHWVTELESVKAVQIFRRLAQMVIPVASRAGCYECSLPLLEAVQLLGPEIPHTAATIAIQKVLSGNLEDGVPDLTKVLKDLDQKTPFAAVARGVLAMTAVARGETVPALKELQAAWSVIGSGGVRNVPLTFPMDTTDYYLVAEILLARFEAAKAVDPPLAAQAARDLEELLKTPLSFGPRRIPALGIMGRLDLLQGRRDAALVLLREARAIPIRSLDDRSDGPIGRLGHQRYRRLVLETLLLALGSDPATAEERDAVGSELAQLGN